MRGEEWRDSQLAYCACGGVLLPIPTVRYPPPVCLADNARPCLVGATTQPAR